jgi:hypothetical protein
MHKDPGNCWTEHVFQRASKQDHQTLNHNDHVSRNVGLLKRELGTTLIEHAEQD